MSAGDGAVILDACVIAPRLTGSVLYALGHEGLYRPVVTRRIAREAWRATRSIEKSRAHGGRRALVRHWRQWPVVSDPAPGALPPLPDPDDAHVLSAAIGCAAPLIVTANLKDFPNKTLAPLGVEAVSPSAFVMGLIHNAPAAGRRALAATQMAMADNIAPGVPFQEALTRARMKPVAQWLAEIG